MNKREDISIIILGAGSGERLGGTGKALLELEGRSYIQWNVELMQAFSSNIIVTLSEADMAHLDDAHHALPCQYVQGGENRQASFAVAFDLITFSKVVVHDVARPLLTHDQMARLVEAAKDHQAVTSAYALPVRDSMVLIEGGTVSAKVEREKLYGLQTPQIFDTAILKDVLAQASREGWLENSLVFLMEKAGIPVHWIEGQLDNLKVTYPEDVEEAARLLRKRK